MCNGGNNNNNAPKRGITISNADMKNYGGAICEGCQSNAC